MSDLKTILHNLEDILEARGSSHGGYGQYAEAMQLLLNLTFGKKLKKKFSKQDVAMILIMHKMARVINADEGADKEDSFIDLAGYSVLAVFLEKEKKNG